VSSQETVARFLSWLFRAGAGCSSYLARSATFDGVCMKVAYIVFACPVLVFGGKLVEIKKPTIAACADVLESI